MLVNTKKIKNFAIKSEIGKGEYGNETVIAAPVDYEEIPDLVKCEDVDCIVRIYPDTKDIFRIQYGNNIARKPKEIEAAVKIFGLNEFWTISKKYDFRTGGFNA